MCLAGHHRSSIKHTTLGCGNRSRPCLCESPGPDSAFIIAGSERKPSWQLVLDKEPLDVHTDSYPDAIYDPEAILGLIYTSGTTGRPKGVTLTHANILANVDHLNYWMPYRKGGVYLHAAPLFHILDFPFMFAAPVFGACQVAIPKFSPQSFCETVERERISHTALVPTMINLLTQFSALKDYDLTSLEGISVRRISHGSRTHSPDESCTAQCKIASGLRTERNRVSHCSAGP